MRPRHPEACFEMRRLWRLSSMVWTMLSANEFVPGYVGVHIANTAAWMALQECEEAASRIEFRRIVAKRGYSLLEFHKDMDTIDSHMDADVVQVFNTLSYFPQTTVMRFWAESNIERYENVSSLTRERCMGCIEDGFHHFLKPLVHLAVPVFLSRRQRNGVRATMRSCPLTELLMTTQKVREWTPLEGSLRLTHADLADAAPLLEDVLKALVRAKGRVVRYTRNPRAGETKMSYVFDSIALMKLLKRSGFAMYDDIEL